MPTASQLEPAWSLRYSTLDRDGSLAGSDENAHWYVVRVNARHEKSVSRMLGLLGHTTFLPLARKTHKYGPRLREYDIPVFPGYVFCNLHASRIWWVAQLPSILDVVGVGGVPAIVPETEICSLRSAIDARLPLRSWPYLEVGDDVHITEGPMAGVRGVVLDRTTNSMRVVLSINLLRRSVLLDVACVDVQKISARPQTDSSARA